MNERTSVGTAVVAKSPQLCHALILAAVFLLALASQASAQQLFTWVDAAGPGTVRSASGMGPQVHAPRSIKLDAALLSEAPKRLVLPSDDGFDVLELRHFEDRGDGDLHWSGTSNGSEWETSIFTVHSGGWLIGSFESSDGHRYTVQASPTGVGRVVHEQSTGPDGHDWCGDYSARSPVSATAPSAPSVAPDTPFAVAQGARRKHLDHLIDIVFLVTPHAEFVVWDTRLDQDQTSDEALTEQIVEVTDFANMVLRNSKTKTRFRYVGHELDPFGQWVNEDGPVFADTEAGGKLPISNLDSPNSFDYLGFATENMNALHAVRREYDADFVHLLTYNWRSLLYGICGEANIFLSYESEATFAPHAFGTTDILCADAKLYGRSTLKWTFIHEMGHNLGLNHSRNLAHNLSQRELDDLSPDMRQAFADVQGHELPTVSLARTEYGYGALINHRHLKKQSHLPLGEGTWWPRKVDLEYGAFADFFCSIDPQPGCFYADGTPKPTEDETGGVTIMAYDPDGGDGDRWKRVPYFSNPQTTLGVGEYGMASADSDAEWKLGHRKWHNAAEALDEASFHLSRLSEHQFQVSRAPSHLRVERVEHLEDPTGVTDGKMRFILSWEDHSDDEYAFWIQASTLSWGEKFYPDGTVEEDFVMSTSLPIHEAAYMNWGPTTGRRLEAVDWNYVPNPLVIRVGSVNDGGPTWVGSPLEIDGLGRPDEPVLELVEIKGRDALFSVSLDEGQYVSTDIGVQPCPCDGVLELMPFDAETGLAVYPIKRGAEHEAVAVVLSEYSAARIESNVLGFTAPDKGAGGRPATPGFKSFSANPAKMRVALKFDNVSANTETLRLRVRDTTSLEERWFYSLAGDINMKSGQFDYEEGRSYEIELYATNGAGIKKSSPAVVSP